MFFEIGVRAATRIPKGVVFGSLPTRLIKSENDNSFEDQKIGFVEVEYKDEELVCLQYGPEFNWLKYICSSYEESKANIKAFINDNGEISFDTSREIEIGEEFLYTFGNQHRQNDGESDRALSGHSTGMIKDKREEPYNFIELLDGVNIESRRIIEDGRGVAQEKTIALTELKQTTLMPGYSSREDNIDNWLVRRDFKTRAVEGKRSRPFNSTECAQKSHYYPEMYDITNPERLGVTNHKAAFQRNDDVLWYSRPVAITRPLGCTCNWPQANLSSSKPHCYERYGETYVRQQTLQSGDAHLTRKELKTGSRESWQEKETDQREGLQNIVVGTAVSSRDDSLPQYSGTRNSGAMLQKTKDISRENFTNKKTLPINRETQDEESQNCDEEKSVKKMNTSPLALAQNNIQDLQNSQEMPAESSSKNKIDAPGDNSGSSVTTTEEKVQNDQSKNGSRFVCNYCGKSYCRRYVLKIHMRTHTGHKPLRCTVCWKSFGDPSNLKKHIRSHARKNAIYTCEHCGRGSFYRLCDLVRHIKFRHRLANTEKWPVNINAEEKKLN